MDSKVLMYSIGNYIQSSGIDYDRKSYLKNDCVYVCIYIYMYIYIYDFAVQQKLVHCYKSTTL